MLHLLRNAIVPCVLALTTATANAQYVGGPDNNGMYTSPLTGRQFNNPMSALIDSQMRQQQNMNIIFQQMMMQEMFNEEWRRIGRPIIEEGRASSAVPAMTDELLGLMLPDDMTDAERASAIEELQRGWDRYVDYARGRGVVPDDVATVTSLALMVGYEKFSGRETTPAQLAGIAADIRAGLLTDPMYQGQGAIAASRTALNFASATTATAALQGEEAREAGRALAEAVWAYPVEAMEPTDTGFIDRGLRIVAEGSGTTTFARTLSDEASARRGLGEPPTPVSDELREMFGDERADEMDQELREEFEQSIADRAATIARFREEVLPGGASGEDLVDVGLASLAALWPIAHEGEVPTAAQLETAAEMIRSDLLADPAIQRMGDVDRQSMADDYAVSTIEAVDLLARAEQNAAEAAAGLRSENPMERMSAMSQGSIADSYRESARMSASAVLQSLFSPRDYERIILTPEGFVEAEE